MRIDLKWLDPNKKSYHKTEVYRSEFKFDDISVAELIATVEPGINEYQDATVEYGKVYYYRLRFIDPPRRPKESATYEFKASAYTGPGAATLMFGDENFGYYGVIDSAFTASPTVSDIRAVFGLPPEPSLLNVLDLHKFSIGGSVRCTYQYPIASGEDIPRDHPILQSLMQGEPHILEYGLHRWAIIVPSADHFDDSRLESRRFPGELRSMLGVITELYTRVEDVQYGNQTGDCLSVDSGSVSFYEHLRTRFTGKDIKYIVSSDWVNANQCNVIDWTPEFTTYPVHPKELHTALVDFTDPAEWNKVLFWPVLVYLGLVGPQ
jgi:hypothetical protein